MYLLGNDVNRFTFQKGLYIIANNTHQTLTRFEALPAHMRCDNDIMRLAAKASHKSASLISAPRPVLMMTALDFILAIVSLLIKCFVLSFNGQCKEI